MAGCQSVLVDGMAPGMEFQMSQTKQFVFGLIAGAVAVPVLGFSAFGWKLDTKVQTMAQEATTAAMKEAFVPVCMAQFRADPEASAHLASLKQEQNSHMRTLYIREGGWATPSGHSEPVTGVAKACANALIAEKQQAQRSQ
jgi:hypothetical protein